MDVVIHTNPHLHNQRTCAEWLKEGFKVHGIDALITSDRVFPGDVHVVQGPHYCYREWLGKPNVIWLNRCFYGDHFYDLSLGWLKADGSRDFGDTDKPVSNGTPPALYPRKWGGLCGIVFGDYGRDSSQEMALARQHFEKVFFRPHPADAKLDSPVNSPDWTLAEVFTMADGAVGHSSTVLVKARINGLQTLSTDPKHVIHWEPDDDEKWLRRLSWCQWSSEQIKAGDCWEHLCKSETYARA